MRRTHIGVLVLTGSLSTASAALAQKYPSHEPEPEPGAPAPETPTPEPETPAPGTPTPSPRSRPAPDADASRGGGAKGDLFVSSTRPHFFVGALGPTFFGINQADRAPGFRQSVFYRGKLALDYGYHVSGDTEGFALGVTLEQSFDSHFYIFNPGFKMWWDIHITELPIFIAPTVKLGYALAACDGCGNDDHAFNAGVGVEGRLVLDDRWMLLFRPVHLDTYFGSFFEETVLVHYDILIGGGLTF